MSIIELSYVHLLREIAEKLGMDVPQFRMTTNVEGQFVAYVDLQIPCEGPVAEGERCWGCPFAVAAVAEQDAAHVAIKILKEKLNLHIKDANYEDQSYYKNMYDHLTNQYMTLFAKYDKIKWELDMLKKCHSSLVAQNEQFVAERAKIRAAIEECHGIINRLDVGTSNPNGDSTDPNLVAAPLL